jgi:exopolysaccharide production protein ExoY
LSFETTLRIKRIIDILASIVLLSFLSPILIAAAIAVKITSKGPIVYAGRRWGVGESTFPCYKFRSMVMDQQAALQQHGLAEFGPEGQPLLHTADPRVTAVGAFLRKTSIDELPQLFNVLLGQMSIVGPRPLPLVMLEKHEGFRRARGLVRPGITGLWQIRGRVKNVTTLAMVDDDLEYIRRLSLALDLYIIVKTFPRILGP